MAFITIYIIQVLICYSLLKIIHKKGEYKLDLGDLIFSAIPLIGTLFVIMFLISSFDNKGEKIVNKILGKRGN